MARLLVINQDREISRRLGHDLERDGHVPSFAETAAEGIAKARREAPDLVLLDWKLPDGGAEGVCTWLTHTAVARHIQVVFVTSRGAEADRIRGFELGASDYVVTPYSVRELLLRVRAVLRRTGRRAPADHVERGRLRVDIAAHRAWVEGREVPLARLELKLLVVLMRRDGRVCTREALLDQVWGDDVNVLDRTVDVTVARLRRKLGRAAGCVQAVRGVGYRFPAPTPRSRS